MSHIDLLVAQKRILERLLVLNEQMCNADEVVQYQSADEQKKLIDQLKSEASYIRSEYFTMKAVAKRFVTHNSCSRKEFIEKFEGLYPVGSLTSYDQLSKLWSWLVREGLVQSSSLKQE